MRVGRPMVPDWAMHSMNEHATGHAMHGVARTTTRRQSTAQSALSSSSCVCVTRMCAHGGQHDLSVAMEHVLHGAPRDVNQSSMLHVLSWVACCGAASFAGSLFFWTAILPVICEQNLLRMEYRTHIPK